MVIREDSQITGTVRNVTRVVHIALPGWSVVDPWQSVTISVAIPWLFRGGAGPIRNYSVTVPEQFVALLGGGGVVDKFRLSEQKKPTQDGPGPPRIDKDLIRGGPGPSRAVRSTTVL